MSRLVLNKSVTVPGVWTGIHVFHVTSDLVWVSDGSNLVSANLSGEKQDHLNELGSDYGGHTVNYKGDLIYIDNKYNIKKRCTNKKVKTTLIKYNTATWKPQCVYSSHSTGDLLVGMHASLGQGKVVRYNSTGEKIQVIERDSNRGQSLYSHPIYISENRNGDVIVSDILRNAVVVTDRDGNYRFSYTGPQSGSGLRPAGICTDAQSNILVCDCIKHNVQILNQHGIFLSLIETSEYGIYDPRGLSYGDKTQTLFICSGNKVNIYHVVYEDSQTDLEDPTEDLLQHMKTELTTVRHARGIVVGCAGAGKTTLLYSLMGKSLDEIKEIKSTRGLQVYEHIFTVKEGSLIATENLQQRPLIRIPVSLLTKKKDKSKDADQRMVDVTDVLTKLEVAYDIPTENTGATGGEEDISLPSDSDNKPKEDSTTTTGSGYQHKAPDSQAEDTLAFTLSPEVIKKLLDAQENEISVSIIDFAGQFTYYACHQIYMRSSAFYILVMDMTKSLEDDTTSEEEVQTGSIFSTWKNKDYVEFWLNSIKSFGGSKAPVLLVATHAEGKTKDDIDDYFACLWRSIPDVDRTWLSENCKENNEFGFELMNISEDKRTLELQVLKNSLADVVSTKLDTQIPVRSSWALLEHRLLDTGKPIISYEEIERMNREVPKQYRLESKEEISNFLIFFHEHGILLYFNGEATRTHAILGLQWFSDAFSRLIADKTHINKDCKRQYIKEWELFNQTGKLNSMLVDALWKDEKLDKPNAQSFIEYKTELMSYMERLRMLVSVGDIDKTPSWYVPCMNKKLFKKDIIKGNLACSSILCFRFTSFAIFVYYRLIAYCMSSLKWKIVPDKKDSCLYQTAAVFEYKNHNVVLGICDKDIQLQVVINAREIRSEISCEVGNLIHEALYELNKTFENTNLSFKRGYKCKKIFCDQDDPSFTSEEELCQAETENIQCSCCSMGEKHFINVQETQRYWEKNLKGKESFPTVLQSPLQSTDSRDSSEKYQKQVDNTQRSYDLETIYTQEWHKSVAHLICGDEAKGTAFRVGSRYLMTAFHVIKQTLEMYITKIIEIIQSDPHRSEKYLRFMEKFDVEISEGDIEETLQKGINKWVNISGNELKINSLLSDLEETGFCKAKDQAMTFIKVHPICVYFGRMKEESKSPKYPLKIDIPFYSKAEDVVLFEVDWTEIPKPFELNKSDLQPENVNIIGHPGSYGNDQILDTKCPLISMNAAERTHYEAVKWWKENCPELSRERIEKSYDDMISKKRVLFHCSQSTTHGASGSPGIIDLDKGSPKVYLMLQEGYPGFAHSDMKEKLTNCPKHYLVESGISMLSVYRLLSPPQFKDVRDDIFHSP